MSSIRTKILGKKRQPFNRYIQLASFRCMLYVHVILNDVFLFLILACFQYAPWAIVKIYYMYMQIQKNLCHFLEVFFCHSRDNCAIEYSDTISIKYQISMSICLAGSGVQIIYYWMYVEQYYIFAPLIFQICMYIFVLTLYF